jgi:glycosyltransferase involved in cell wall biosynthesis
VKKVLIIAHHFPPMGGPGTSRSTQLVRHLQAFGFEPIVLTIPFEDIEAGPYPIDHSLMSGLEDVRIVRVATREPRRLKFVLRKLRLLRVVWYVLYPLMWENCALWPLSAYRTARRLIDEEGIDLIYTSSGPFSSIPLGCMLKIASGVPWVADLRDPFTDGYMWVWPSKAHWYLSRWIESVLLRVPDQVIVNTPEVERLYLSRSLVERERLTHVTNGYSPWL